MKILAIETSCDETAVSVLEGTGNSILVLGNALASQVELHAKYGGVFPAMAKRAHTEKIVLLLKEALEQAGLLKQRDTNTRMIANDTNEKIKELLAHEKGLAEQVLDFFASYEIPDIDRIAVTTGPGLEPALWVGVNTAKALSLLWQKPIHAINHMEGHVISAVFKEQDLKHFELSEVNYPTLALLVSGGHTELVLIEQPLSYKKIGQTRDDAVGEAFDKVARMLGLQYPGGPKISLLAKEAREKDLKSEITLPRPMLHSGDYDFSFSGLKTAVLYATMDKTIPEEEKMVMAREFEEAAIEVLIKKTFKAVEEFNVQTLVIGGGVAANTYLREQIEKMRSEKFPDLTVHFPTKELSTDNSIMIGMTSYYQSLHGNKKNAQLIKADGNLSF